MTKSFLKQFINCKNIQTAGKYSVDSSKLKEAVDYFKTNPNLTPKVLNIKYMVDFDGRFHSLEELNMKQKKLKELEKWVWAIHGQVIIIAD